MKNRLLAMALVSFWSLSAAAQMPPIQYTPNPDSPLGTRNPSAPAGLSEFDFAIGDWQADVTITRPSGPLNFIARWHNTWIVDGQVIFHEWRGPFTTGGEFRTYDAASKSWKGYNYYPGPVGWKETNAQWHADKGEMIITSHTTTPQGEGLHHEIYYDITPDSFKIRSEVSYDDGKTWEPGRFSMTSTRLPTSSGPTEE